MHDIGRLTNDQEFEFSIGEMEGEAFEDFETCEVAAAATEGPFSEEEEMELAAELVGIQSEEQLDEFLGKLIKKAAGAVKKFGKSPFGKQLFGILKGAAKTALPLAGKAVGGFFGGPAGAAIGGKLAGAAGKAFGLELEGLSPEDQEYEVARRFVRFAGAAAQNTAAADPGATEEEAATVGAMNAARRHAPGLVRDPRAGGGGGGGRSPYPPYRNPAAQRPTGRPCDCGGAAQQGQWFRQNGRIVILGA